MVTNQFAKHGCVVIRPFQISVAGVILRANNSDIWAGWTGDARNRITGMTPKNTGGVAFVVAFDSASSDEHDACFRMVGAPVGVFDCGTPEFRECDDDQVIPGRLVSVFDEVLAERVNRPGDPALEIR